MRTASSRHDQKDVWTLRFGTRPMFGAAHRRVLGPEQAAEQTKAKPQTRETRNGSRPRR